MEENKAQTTQAAEAEVSPIAGAEASEGAAVASPSQTPETNTAEFADTAEQSAPPAAKEQAADLNREYARRRRESEQKRKIEETRVQAVIDTLGGVNPYTHEKVTDAADVEEYLLMKRIETNGGDPLTDYAKYRKIADKEGARTAKETADKDAWFESDRAAFLQKHPDVKLSELLSDKGFQHYAEGKVGVRPLSEIYAGYREIVGEVEGKARDIAAQAIANKQASPGTVGASASAESDFFTRDQVRKMSKQDIHQNYEKIRASMAKW